MQRQEFTAEIFNVGMSRKSILYTATNWIEPAVYDGKLRDEVHRSTDHVSM